MIAVCPNPYRDKDLIVSRKISELLSAHGYKSVFCPIFAGDADVIPADINPCSLKELAGECSLIIVIGGDGTILSAVREMENAPIPVLGLNLGTKGFLSTLEMKDMELILKAAKGEMKISVRMMLDVELIRRGEVICSGSVLNDVVVHGHGDCIRVAALCGDDTVTSFSGDGIIIATPTGSTGYSMSAGGPIAEPAAENIILTPICPHKMGSRPYVLAPYREITIIPGNLNGKSAYVSFDGIFAANLENDDKILVRRSEYQTHMVDFGLKSFYDIANEKLT